MNIIILSISTFQSKKDWEHEFKMRKVMSKLLKKRNWNLEMEKEKKFKTKTFSLGNTTTDKSIEWIGGLSFFSFF